MESSRKSRDWWRRRTRLTSGCHMHKYVLIDTTHRCMHTKKWYPSFLLYSNHYYNKEGSDSHVEVPECEVWKQNKTKDSFQKWFQKEVNSRNAKSDWLVKNEVCLLRTCFTGCTDWVELFPKEKDKKHTQRNIRTQIDKHTFWHIQWYK